MMNRDDEIKNLQAKLPKGFIVGTASSAHQIEGNNTNDWTEFESVPGNIKNDDTSELATNHYHLFDSDFQMLEDLGFRAHRMSIEWSRIYPEPGKIDTQEIAHYRKVLQSLKKHQQKAFVTLYHFTTPIWFSELGGFSKRENIEYWTQYVSTIATELGDLIDVICTVNEPAIYAVAGYLGGNHSPGKSSLRLYLQVSRNLYRAHYEAVKIFREYDPTLPIGLVKSLIHFQPKHKFNPIDFVISRVSDWFHNLAHLRALHKGKLPFSLGIVKYDDIGDFLGVNYYMRSYAGIGKGGLIVPHSGNERLTMMEWGTAPDGLSIEMLRAWRLLHLPIYVTENGIATKDDKWRETFILDHLVEISRCIRKGVDIRGYFYWSNLDNFEWELGYYPEFGLISYDNESFERKAKPSAKMLGSIAQNLS